MSAEAANNLVERLLQLRAMLEHLQAKLKLLQSKRELTVGEEFQVRDVNRDLHKLTYEFLPWARLGPDASRAAEILWWIHRKWTKYSGA